MCETCDLLDKMYEVIDVKDPNMRLKVPNMIYETNQQIPEVERYNAAYHIFIGSTPTNEMPHFRIPIIEQAIRDFCTQNNLRLD